MNKNINNKPLKADDEDDELLSAIQGNQHLGFYSSTQTAKCIKFYLDEDIREPKYYRSIINELDNLGENDICRIIVNTHGGRLDSSLQIIDAIQTTQAEVYVDVVGTAASAGSLIALAAPHLSITPYSTMMIHHASHGTYGSASNVAAYSAFVDKQCKKLMQDVYEGFLTEAEIQDVFTGKEMWMDSDEILRRLQKRSDWHEAKARKEAKGTKAPAKTKANKLAKDQQEIMNAIAEIAIGTTKKSK